MKTVQHVATLDYYDGPILFQARDRAGGHYLAVATDTGEGVSAYAVVGVSGQALRDFRCGKVDLRHLMVEAGSDEWYVARPSGVPDEFDLQRQVAPLADGPHLAGEGYWLDPAEASCIAVLDAAQRRNNLVVELKVEPPDGDLDRVRGLMQALVVEAVRLARQGKGSWPGATPVEQAARMDVADATVPGILLLESCDRECSDLVGLPAGLASVDALLERLVQDFEGTFINSELRQLVCPVFVRLLDFLARQQLELQFTWAEPAWALAKQHSITATQARGFSKLIAVANAHWG